MKTSSVLVSGVCACLVCAGLGIAQDDEVPPPVQAAIADLAARLNIQPDDIKVVEIEKVTWPDGSLGHPQPGQVYVQILIPGYKVILEAAGKRYEYHTDRNRRAVYVGEVEAAETDIARAAIQDLAGRLRIAPEDVEVVTLERVQWPDGALGWREPGMMYTQAIVPGYRAILAAGGRQFEYHLTETAAFKLGGMCFEPDATEAVVLAALPAETPDANLNMDLHRISLASGQGARVVQYLSDFAPTLDGRDLLVTRRLSRSLLELLLVNAEGEEQSLGKAFTFSGLSWSPLGERFAYWQRPRVGEANWSLQVGRPGEEPQVIDLPVDEGARALPGPLAWGLEGLAISVRTRPAEPYQTFFWDGQQVSKAGDFEVLAWIPHTSSVVGRRPTEGGGISLLAVQLPAGRETPLMTAANILSAAPLPSLGAVLAAIENGDGEAGLVRVSYDGRVTDLPGLEKALRTELRADALGGICAINYRQERANEAVIMDLGAFRILSRVPDCPRAVPVRQVGSPPETGDTGQAPAQQGNRITRLVFAGNTVASDEELSGAILTQAGHIVDPRVIRREVRRMEDYYEKQGYIAKVTEAVVDDAGVVTFIIAEMRIEAILIEGLAKVEEEVVRAALGLKVGDLFHQPEVAAAVQAVMRLGLFDKVNADIQPGEQDPVTGVILVITVKEK